VRIGRGRGEEEEEVLVEIEVYIEYIGEEGLDE
jgi:hypothetical protein